MEPALPGEAARESLLPVLGLAEQLAATYGRGTGLGWPACLPACPRPAQRCPGSPNWSLARRRARVEVTTRIFST